ncbi:MAG: TonB-dependent receptor [Acidobacteriota bacterium]|nr:TonB-dependent receptor [Acidobacteriota bacterium]
MVSDKSGGVIPAATVALTNEGTGLRLVVKTGDTGYYMFPMLRVGTYRVEIEAAGFAKFLQLGIPLNVQQDVVINAILQPGSLTQTIEVTGAPPLLQTQNASVGQVIGTNAVNDLPLNGRNWTQLAQLVAGATYSQPDSSGRPYFSANGHPLDQNDYRLNGINNNDEAWTNPEPYVALPPPDAIAEFKVQTDNYSAEFGHSSGAVVNATVKSGTNRLHGDIWEYVRNDKFDAAQFFQNSQGLTKGIYRMNQFGGTVGGPVFIPHVYDGRNKTFFFVDYQGTRIRQATAYTDTVPTSSMVSSGFTNMQDLITYQSGTRSDVLGRTFRLGTIFDPATTRQVTAGQADPISGITAGSTGVVRDPFYSGSLSGLTDFTTSAAIANLNHLPAARFDANALKLLALYPAPTISGYPNNFAYNPAVKDSTNNFGFRADQNFSDRDQLFVVGNWSHRGLYTPPAYPGLAGDANSVRGGFRTEGADAIGVSETHSFSSTTLNEVRLGYSRSPLTLVGSYGNTMGIPAQFGIQGIPQAKYNGGLPAIAISGLTSMGTRGSTPTVASSATWDLTENLTMVHGAHTLKAGFQGDYIMTPILQPARSHGLFNFGGVYTGVPNTTGGGTGIAQLLLTPTTSSVGGYNNVGGSDAVNGSSIAGTNDTRYYYGAYFQDDWRATRKLTLNLGVRWDHTTPYVEKYGAQVNFIPGSSGAQFLMPSSRCREQLSASFTTLAAKDGISVACASDPSLGLTQRFNFGPRIGLAYQVNPKIVTRAGYGIFYGALGSIGYSPNIGNNYPFLFNFSFSSPDSAHPITYYNSALATLETGLSPFAFTPDIVNASGLALAGRQYNYQTPYYEDYNFSLQYQVTPNQTFTLAYVGNQSHHMDSVVGENSPTQILPPGTNPQNYIPFPDFARGSNYEMTGAGTFYNGLQASFERRFSNGLYMLTSYTFSKCRSDWRSASDNTIGGYRAALLPGFGIQPDYAYCDADVPDLFHFSATYSLPFGRGSRFLTNSKGVVNQLIGGWRANSIWTLESGMPFTIGCPEATTSDYGCNALLVPGQNMYGGPHSVNQWLNPSAFAKPPAATTIGQTNYAPLGGEPTQAHGPGMFRLDASLFKQFPVAEGKSLEFRAEFFNLTNTPWFANPGSLDFTNTTTFGRITSVRDGANDPRQIQFALKFYW